MRIHLITLAVRTAASVAALQTGEIIKKGQMVLCFRKRK